MEAAAQERLRRVFAGGRGRSVPILVLVEVPPPHAVHPDPPGLVSDPTSPSSDTEAIKGLHVMTTSLQAPLRSDF